jgi:hypothetical protein
MKLLIKVYCVYVLLYQTPSYVLAVYCDIITRRLDIANLQRLVCGVGKFV